MKLQTLPVRGGSSCSRREIWARHSCPGSSALPPRLFTSCTCGGGATSGTVTPGTTPDPQTDPLPSFEVSFACLSHLRARQIMLDSLRWVQNRCRSRVSSDNRDLVVRGSARCSTWRSDFKRRSMYGAREPSIARRLGADSDPLDGRRVSISCAIDTGDRNHVAADAESADERPLCPARCRHATIDGQRARSDAAAAVARDSGDPKFHAARAYPNALRGLT